MAADFITKIRATYNQFTKAEKKVADFILTNPKEVLFMSITDLAEACNVGDTSVFRFCKTMELKGYQEFKMMLSLGLSEEEEMGSRITMNINRTDTLSQLAQKVYNTNVSALTETYSLFQADQFHEVMELLGAAEKICFFGVGASMLTAMKAMNKFMRITPKVFCVQDSHMQSMMATSLGNQDVAMIFSYSGATKDTIHVAKLAANAGAKVICVTRFVRSPLTSYADITLLCGANEGPLQGGSTSAEISQLFLIDLMYTEYYRRYYETCCKNNEKVSASVLDKMF